MTEQTGNERQIAHLQFTLDYFAQEIDTSVAEDGEDDNQYAFCMRMLHAQTSALVYLLKKGQTNLEYKNRLGD
jgi:hypothetical protein